MLRMTLLAEYDGRKTDGGVRITTVTKTEDEEKSMAEIIQVDEHSWRIEDNGVRFFVLEGTEKALLIDSGMNTPDAREIAEKITKKPLELLNTHVDRDHVSGSDAFESLYLCAAEEENYRAHSGKGNIRAVKEGDIIDLGDRPLEIIEIPGHTPGSIAILDINSRILISGDSVQNGIIFMFGPLRNMETYVGSLKKLITFTDRFDCIWPSHGDIPVTADLIQKLIEYAETILAGKAEGQPVERFGPNVLVYQFEEAGFLYN